MSTERYREELRRLRSDSYDKDPSAAFCRDYHIPWEDYTVQISSNLEPIAEPHQRFLLLPADTMVLRRVFVELAAGEPVRTRISVMPADLVINPVGVEIMQTARQPWPGGTMGELVALGHWPARVHEVVRGRLPTPWEAEQLVLPLDASVFEISRFFETADGQRVEASELTYPQLGNALEWDAHLEMD